jgi:hypothetical protein
MDYAYARIARCQVSGVPANLTEHADPRFEYRRGSTKASVATRRARVRRRASRLRYIKGIESILWTAPRLRSLVARSLRISANSNLTSRSPFECWRRSTMPRRVARWTLVRRRANRLRHTEGAESILWTTPMRRSLVAEQPRQFLMCHAQTPWLRLPVSRNTRWRQRRNALKLIRAAKSILWTSGCPIPLPAFATQCEEVFRGRAGRV